MSPSGRCAYFLLVTAIVAMGIQPFSWLNYPWPVWPAFIGVRWVPLVAWAILADVGIGLRLAILVLPLLTNDHADQQSGDFFGRIAIPLAAALLLLPARWLGVRLTRSVSSKTTTAPTRRFNFGDLLMAIVALAATPLARGFVLREYLFYWPAMGGFGLALTTAVWFACLGFLILAPGFWRLMAIIAVAGGLAILFRLVQATVYEYYRVVSLEHPPLIAREFLGTQALYLTISLLVIFACGYRLSWKRPSWQQAASGIPQRRSLKRFVNRSVALIRALGPAPKTIEASTSESATPMEISALKCVHVGE